MVGPSDPQGIYGDKNPPRTFSKPRNPSIEVDFNLPGKQSAQAEQQSKKMSTAAGQLRADRVSL